MSAARFPFKCCCHQIEFSARCSIALRNSREPTWSRNMLPAHLAIENSANWMVHESYLRTAHYGESRKMCDRCRVLVFLSHEHYVIVWNYKEQISWGEVGILQWRWEVVPRSWWAAPQGPRSWREKSTRNLTSLTLINRDFRGWSFATSPKFGRIRWKFN